MLSSNFHDGDFNGGPHLEIKKKKKEEEFSPSLDIEVGARKDKCTAEANAFGL